jgi:proteasome alpha subunit
MGAIGHPGDIERLRMAAIEVTSTEGFTRSTQDVSLRRLATFSLSPALKAAFEQIYGPPYLARMLFAELGREGEGNLFVRLDFDGTMHTSGGPHLRTFEEYGVLAGTGAQAAAMEKHLGGIKHSGMGLEEAMRVALDAWTVGFLSRDEGDAPGAEAIEAARKEQLAGAVAEVAVLERSAKQAAAYRALSGDEVGKVFGGG